jgi:glycosyltransferase involved in cell wall biosynthesis
VVIVYVVADGINEFNSSNFRVAIPTDALLEAGHEVHILNVRHWMINSEYAKSVCKKADIIHLQRVLIDETHDNIRYWRRHGKAVVVDFDDAYDLIHDDNAAAPFWLHGRVTVRLEDGYAYEKTMGNHPVSQFKKGLTACSGLITPSPILSNDWMEGAPEFVVKNYLDERLYEQAPKHDNSPHILIGWGGSLSHVQSWADSGINEAIKMVLQDRDHVRLQIVGDKRVVDQLPVRKDRVVFTPYVGWWNWQHTLMRYDIGLAPLAGDYDDRRSNLKVAEYLLAGLPFVASKSPVYEEFWEADSGIFVQHGHDKETYDDRVAEWYKSTIDVIDNLCQYREKGQNNIEEYGKMYSSKRGVNAILATYKKIIDINKTRTV